jgi:glutamate decarboxylase
LARALKDDIITALKSLDELKPNGHFDVMQPFAH